MELILRKTHVQTPKQGDLFLFYKIYFVYFSLQRTHVLSSLAGLSSFCGKTEERQFVICFAAYKPLVHPTTVMMKEFPSNTQSKVCEREMRYLGKQGARSRGHT